MIRVYPINSKGEQCGPVQSKTDQAWSRLVRAFGSKLRWKEAKEVDLTKEDVKEVRLIAESSTKKAKRKNTNE
jgi:hypothetical protein